MPALAIESDAACHAWPDAKIKTQANTFIDMLASQKKTTSLAWQWSRAHHKEASGGV